MSLHELNSNDGRDVYGLPVPDDDALVHSNELADRIRAEIDSNNGSITFDRYMEMALYEPGLGYYSAGSGKLGNQGDFVTAPEISCLYSYCLARQCRQVLERLNQGVILELGAGTGRMACDILLYLKRHDSLPQRYIILETSADLKQRQRELLGERVPEYSDRVEWLDALPENPVTGLMLANEVLDALPVKRVVIDNNHLYELNVTRRDRGFTWLEKEAGGEVVNRVRHIEDSILRPWQGRYVTEVNLAIDPWIASLSDCLQQGLILLIDYGYTRNEYYHPQRPDGTLLCHYRHRAHSNPFLYPGLQDITASVDFTTVAEAAVASDLQVAGYTTQAHFLTSSGLDEVFAESSSDDPKKQLELSGQIKKLVFPGEMGERFKVMGLGRNVGGKLMGFSFSDQRGRL